MRLSTFNVIKSQDDTTWVYNTFTQGFIKLSTCEWKELEASVENLMLDSSHPLVRTGIVVNSVSEQLTTYKYSYYANMFKDITPLIYIAPSMDCNLNCFYCFEKGNKYAGVMNDEVIRGLVDFICKTGKNKISIIWFGGEPLMGYPQILSICNELQERRIEYTSSLITNGTLLTSAKLQQIHTLHLKYIQISLDGVKECHDKRRMFKSGAPSFDVIMSNLKNLLEETSIPVILQITVDKTNIDAYDSVLNYVKSHFSAYHQSGRLRVGKNYVQNRTGFDTQENCFSNIEIIEDKSYILCSGNTDIDIDFPGLSMPCMFRSKGCFAIDPKGDIYKCIEHLGSPKNKIGSIIEQRMSVAKIANYALENDPFADSQCVKCSVLPICGGGCPIDRINQNKGIIRSCCSKYKDTIQELLPHLYNIKYAKL